MAEERISSAMARIEAALDRIERAAAERPVDPAHANDGLVSRHEALREAVGASLVELDALIERIEP